MDVPVNIFLLSSKMFKFCFVSLRRGTVRILVKNTQITEINRDWTD